MHPPIFLAASSFKFLRVILCRFITSFLWTSSFHYCQVRLLSHSSGQTLNNRLFEMPQPSLTASSKMFINIVNNCSISYHTFGHFVQKCQTTHHFQIILIYFATHLPNIRQWCTQKLSLGEFWFFSLRIPKTQSI